MADTDDQIEELSESDRNTILADAFKQTSLERDKSLLSISSAGVALLVSLLSIDNQLQCAEKVCYILAFLGFTICIISVIYVFGKNREYLVEIKKRDQTETKKIQKRLDCSDKTAVYSFSGALFFTVLIGILQLI